MIVSLRHPRLRIVIDRPIREMPVWHRREECLNCVTNRDRLGRMPIGFCGPDCVMRRARDGEL